MVLPHISGCSKDNFPFVLRAVSSLLCQSGIIVSLEDIQGDTPLNAINSLLQKRLFRQSFLLAKLLLESNSLSADSCYEVVNHVNSEGRSLLSQSVCYGDESIDLSRLLLNYGAKIFPTRASDLNTTNKNLSIR